MSDSRSGLATRRVSFGDVGGAVAAGPGVIDGASWSVAALLAEDVAALAWPPSHAGRRQYASATG